VEIALEDTGIGIPERHLSKIFDPFFTTKETGKGTGMGLSVVYNLVKQNGGEIRVTSKPDRGSLFRLLFPRLPGKEEAREIPAWNGTVLVAEKNPGRQNLLRDVLGRLRFDVIPARDDQDAVEIYSRKKDTIDWVILDSDYLEDAPLSPVTRLLHLNPRIKLLVTHRPNAPSAGPRGHPPLEPGAHIEHFQFPSKPETLLRSLEKVFEKPTV